MNRYYLAGLSVLGGVISALAWTEWCPGLIILAGFAPFLLIEDYLYNHPEKYSPVSLFSYLLPGFVIFATFTLGWIRAVSMFAAIFVILAASLLMTFALWVAHIIHLKAGKMPFYLSFISLWLSLELLCLKTSILSPWINLGNGLAKDTEFIQWFEVTGSPGGTLWILLSNLVLARLILSLLRKGGKSAGILLSWLALLVIPSIFSLNRFSSIVSSANREREVVIVQPNSDPFTKKFTVPFEEQLRSAIELAGTAATGKTEWIVLPETTVDDPVDENDPGENKYVLEIKAFLNKFPAAGMIAGMVTSATGPADAVNDQKNIDQDPNPRFRKYYNSALKIDTGKVIGIYHKSKLVPGFETAYSAGPVMWLRKLLPQLGGTKWGYEPQKERICFANSDSSVWIAPVICYESIYGEFVTDYVKKGAGSIFVITNDGWWKNTNGYKHHFAYSTVRAIETRRPVIRSANTGISGIIDISGKVIQKTEWWVPAVIRGSFIPETRITPYVRYGDFILHAAVIIAGLIILMVFVYLPAREKLR